MVRPPVHELSAVNGHSLRFKWDWKEPGGLDRNSAFMVRWRVRPIRRKHALEHHSGVRRRIWQTIHDYAGHHRTASREYDCGKPRSQSSGIEADCESVARHRGKAGRIVVVPDRKPDQTDQLRQGIPRG